MTWTYT